MKAIHKTIGCLSFMLVLSVIAQAQGWRSIEPLHATRADVEQILGKPESESPTDPSYKFKDGILSVWYSSKPCEGSSGGWRVAPGTVTGFRFSYSAPQPKFAELKLDERKYKKVIEGDFLDYVTYRNDEEGVKYEIYELQGLVFSVTRYPAAKDDYLRCPAPPPDPDDGVEYSRKFDAYSRIPSEEEKGRLDNFATQMLSEPVSRGYIIVYSGRQTDARAASQLAKCAGDYLVRVQGVDKERIVMKYGGQREEFEIELWIRPNGYRAPEEAIGKPDIKYALVEGRKRRRQRKCAF